MTRTLPLAGLTVISLEQAVAVPFATRQLADLGARVIKVERPEGDFARGYDTTVRGMSSYFVWLNRGKQSLVLDLKSPEGQADLGTLIETADVFVQNLAPGAVERLGFGADDVLGRNPRMIHASVSGYGRGGSYDAKKAYDLLIQCEAGLLDVTGTPSESAKVGISIADIAAGMYTYTGILTALLHRASTGEGDVIEVSMLEALGEWMTQPYLFAEYGDTSPVRSGAHHASIAPYGPFDAIDGRVFLSVQNEREWARFCDSVLGRPNLATDERFAGNAARVVNRAELHHEIEAVCGDLTVDSITERLESAGIANARLRTMSEFSKHPQLSARGRWVDVDTPVGAIRSMLPPVVSRNAGVTMGAVPSVGEHTELIRAELGELRR